MSSDCQNVSEHVNLDRKASDVLTQTDLNKLIINYFFTEGYHEALEIFLRETGLQNIEIPTDQEATCRVKVIEAIQDGRMLDAISIVEGNFPDVLANNKSLRFQLLIQHVVELIRNEEVEVALEFAQVNLAEEGRQNAEALSEIERVMALLAFSDPTLSPFADVLLLSQRFKLASQVNEAILRSMNMESNSKISTFCKLLLWTQNELDSKKVKYNKMTDLGTATIAKPSK